MSRPELRLLPMTRLDAFCMGEEKERNFERRVMIALN
jgi:hypothetical protein